MPRPKGKTYENSMTSKVIQAVEARGTATVDDLLPDFPGRTRKQIHDALSNARDIRRLRVKVIGRGRAAPSIWEPGVHIPSPLPEVKPTFPLPSVWALGNPRPWEGQWPPLAEGRAFALLGDWNSEEVA